MRLVCVCVCGGGVYPQFKSYITSYTLELISGFGGIIGGGGREEEGLKSLFSDKQMLRLSH